MLFYVCFQFSSPLSLSLLNVGGHDNTERGYLSALKEKLQDALEKEEVGGLEVLISTRDRHPLVIM